MKKITMLCLSIMTLSICGHVFADVVPYSMTNGGSAVFAHCPADKGCRLGPGSPDFMNESYDTDTNAFTINVEANDPAKIPPLVFSNNEVRQNLCYQVIAENGKIKNLILMHSISYCLDQNNNYEDVLMLGQYLNGGVIHLSYNGFVNVNHDSYGSINGEISVTGIIFQPIA